MDCARFCKAAGAKRALVARERIVAHELLLLFFLRLPPEAYAFAVRHPAPY